MRELIASVGGRKWILTGLLCGFILVAGSVLLWVGKVSGDQWLGALDRAVWVAGGYLGANVLQKVGDAFGDRGGP